MGAEDARLRTFWDERYRSFSLSESGWMGAGERLNDRIYACKLQALRAALAARGLTPATRWSVLDAGCGQGYFARFYRREFPGAQYVGLDISERAVQHLRREIQDVEFHRTDLCDWSDPSGRAFDVIQSFEVLHLILDDDTFARALASLSSRLAPRGSLFVTAALPDCTLQPNDYLRYRSRALWADALASLKLRIVTERPMYFWLPAGGPRNKYLRYALTRLGPLSPDVLYFMDRAALTFGLPPVDSMDCQTQLLTIERIA